MALTEIQKVRIEIQDYSELPLLADEEINYFLEKNSGSVRLASLDAARCALLKLSQVGDEQISIFSVKGSKAAEAYRESLRLYLSNSNLNPNLSEASIYAAGISKSDALVYSSDVDSTIKLFEF